MLRLAALVALTVPTLVAGPALANQIWTTDCNFNPQSSFALDELVCGMGDLDSPCNSSIIAAADIWIMPAGAPDFTLAPGSIPQHIVTAGGGGGFWGEYLWLPPLSAGTFDILIDEDCDGVFDPGLDLRTNNAFTVIGVLSGANIDVAAIKADALAEATRWGDIRDGWALTMAAVSLVNKVNTFASALGGDFSGLIGWVYGKVTGLPTDYNSAVLQIGTQIINGATSAMELHFIMLAADPPDSNYEPLVTLDWSVVQTPFADAELTAYPWAASGTTEQEFWTLEAANVMAEQAVLGDALIHQFEKFQGADAAGDQYWRYVTAQRVHDLAAEMDDHYGRMEQYVQEWHITLEGPPEADYLHDPTEFQAIQSRLAADGLDEDEVALLELYGLDEDARDAFVAATIATDVPPEPFGPIMLLDEMLDGIASARASLDDLQDQADAVVDDVAQVVTPHHPQASAGADYEVVLGQTLTLSAAASSDPDGDALTYAWDLDADGAFDDATGAAPTLQPSVLGSWLIGVVATDPSGNDDADWARVTVTAANQPPTLVSFTPEGLTVEVEVGEELPWSVAASDPEGGPVTYEWTLDEDVVGSAAEGAWTPVEGDLGLHLLRVRVADDSPLSADLLEQRQVLVVAASGGDDDDDAADDDDATDDDDAADDDDDATDDDDDDGDDDDSAGRAGGCSCSSSGASGAPVALLLMLALVWGRRRRP